MVKMSVFKKLAQVHVLTSRIIYVNWKSLKKAYEIRLYLNFLEIVMKSKGLQFTFIPARKCFWGYTVLNRYVLKEEVNGKTIVIYLAKIV
jgi:hypothetical protein